MKRQIEPQPLSEDLNHDAWHRPMNTKYSDWKTWTEETELYPVEEVKLLTVTSKGVRDES